MPDLPRLDGAAAWAALPDDHRALIGAAAIELVAAVRGAEAPDTAGFTARPWEAAFLLLLGELGERVIDACPALDAFPRPLPASLGPVCRGCGCSEHDPCETGSGPCGWAAEDLCTACAAEPVVLLEGS